MIKIFNFEQKASTDKKDYRAIRLPNGLRVLLISDTTYDLEKLDLEENLEQEEEDEMDESEHLNDLWDTVCMENSTLAI